MKIKTGSFFIISLIYSILSWAGFVYISGLFSDGGWGAIGWLVFLGPPIYGTLLFLSMIAYLICNNKNLKSVFLPAKPVYFLLSLQAILYLLNTSLRENIYSEQINQLYITFLFTYGLTILWILFKTYSKAK